MKTLKEALFSKKNIKSNPYGLTKDDIKGALRAFPMGVVVRMMEEQELQGNRPDVKVFQLNIKTLKNKGGFDWSDTEALSGFWLDVLHFYDFDLFFKQYPEYERYNLS